MYAWAATTGVAVVGEMSWGLDGNALIEGTFLRVDNRLHISEPHGAVVALGYESGEAREYRADQEREEQG